jgi:hypothetical protein
MVKAGELSPGFHLHPTDLLGSILPIAGAVQWVSGLILAVVTALRAKQFGRDGRVPLLLARISIVIFALSLVELLWTVTRAREIIGPVMPNNFTSAPWQLRTLLLMSLAAWVLLAIAAAWNGTLAIAQRRRVAAAELQRRTDRALQGIERRAPE